MEASCSNRITYKRVRPNPLFQDWLEELYSEAKAKKSKLEPILGEALTSIAKYPVILHTGAECRILKGFDKRLCMFLDKRLEVHRRLRVEQNAVSCNNKYSVDSSSYQSQSSSLDIDAIHLPPEVNQVKVAKEYKPLFKSGGYAILIGLYTNSKNKPNKPALTKKELIKVAQPYSNYSFTRPAPITFYTAWSSMAKLISKDLVLKVRTKKVLFSLTPKGETIAEQLLIEYPTYITNDIIFSSPSTSISKDRTVKPASTTNISNCLLLNKPSPSHATVSQAKRLIQHEVDAAGPSTCGVEHSRENNANIKLYAGSFDIIILIDKHEVGGGAKKNDPTVSQFNMYPDLKYEFRSLKVGDFTWIARNKSNEQEELVLPYIVERKRMDDLAHSIKDGRFHEQKFRLRKCNLSNVLYLVENFGSNKHVGLPLQSLMQALANTRVQDRFHVHVTDSLANTVKFLAMMTKRLTVQYQYQTLKGYHGVPRENSLMTFEFFNTASSKSNVLTVTETFQKLLLQLKGVSVDKVLAVTEVYKTPLSLYKKYSSCSPKEGEMLLANLKFGDLNRNVGPSVSKAIYSLFTK